jgi:TRAP-type C4-dicarboxylate transport system permease small subunit
MDKDDTGEWNSARIRSERNLITDLNDYIIMLMRVVQVVLFSAMIIVVCYEVIMRYVFYSPTVWGEGAARFFMIWMVLFGMALAIRHREHIRVDFFVYYLPERAQLVLGYLRIAIILIIAGVLVHAGYRIADANWTQIATGIGIPVFWKYLAVPVAAVLMFAFLIEKLRQRDTEPF